MYIYDIFVRVDKILYFKVFHIPVTRPVAEVQGRPKGWHYSLCNVNKMSAGIFVRWQYTFNKELKKGRLWSF